MQWRPLVHLPYKVNKRSKYKIWSCDYILNITHILSLNIAFLRKEAQHSLKHFWNICM